MQIINFIASILYTSEETDTRNPILGYQEIDFSIRQQTAVLQHCDSVSITVSTVNTTNDSDVKNHERSMAEAHYSPKN